MKLKQKRPSRYVQSRSPPPSPSPNNGSPIRSPIPDEIDWASITSNMVEVSCPFSISWVPGTTSRIACTNKKRKGDETTICIIPKSIMHNIFLWIPALTLRRMTKYVCKEWNAIISDSEFVRDHSILNASDGFLVQKFIDGNHPSLSFFVEIRNDNNAVTIHPTPLVFETVHASSGGFLLITEDTPASNFSVLDPVNGNKVKLPRFLIRGASLLFSGFAQDRSTRTFKVVRFYSSDKCFGSKFCFVLSLGVKSKWRPIHVPSYRLLSLPGGITICAGKYVYYVTFVYDFGYDILIFDAETESIYYCRTFRNLKDSSHYFLPMEDSLSSLVIPRKNYEWKVWKLTDFTPGIWELIFKIDMSSHSHLIERELSKGCVLIKPLTWLRNGELILFYLTYPSVCCIAYDVRKGDFFWFEFPDHARTGILAHFHVRGIFSLNSP